VSGPAAMAVASLIIGNYGVTNAMSEVSRDYLLKFWDLVDQILNATLFLLIGLQGIALLDKPALFVVGLATVPLVLIARAVSVLPPLAAWRNLVRFRQAFRILTWGACAAASASQWPYRCPTRQSGT
jgi:monovalent cation:H+ antiporter, CPA1 family